VPPHIPTPNHQDIALPERRPLPLQRLLNLLNRNFMPTHRARSRSLLLLIPSQPVTQHTASHNPALLAPVVRAVRISSARLFVCESVVVLLTRLVRKVLQAIPLRSGLRVNVHLVIHSAEVGEVTEVDLLLVELFAIETGELHVVKFPV
jgi:hypothetical protein